jgi:putative membrane protein insertion efficiency factor
MKFQSESIKIPMLAMIRFYQMAISPMFGHHCRFYPSCSKYAYTAISIHGPVNGSILAVKRLLKCHPFHPGGYDPAPEILNHEKKEYSILDAFFYKA